MQAIFAQQLQALGGTAPAQPAPVQPAPAAAPAPAAVAAAPAPKAVAADDEEAQPKGGFKLGRGPSVTGGTMDATQTAFARDLADRYAAKHAKSKAYTAKYRDVHADPRTAAGFRAEWKELVFPIVADRSKGAYIHDLDGNDFVDLVNGFGQTAFGHSPDFVVEAVTKQMEKGFPIGPQADLAGPVAEKFARWVGHERVTFCNTGSEAVMAAMRVARTVTGRDLVVVFDRDYHGQFDEVLVKGRTKPGDPRPLPIAPGIPRSGIANMIVLPYGADSALDWIRENIKDVAAVIVEPVQSRHPEHRPESFVRTLRDVTREGGTALVIDEVVTGFRTSRRGMQGVWGIQGDMATYGKVVGGGMPIGVLAGDARFMDALDGGPWQYGDDSRPEKVPTFFAGTFVRHPLVLAAVDASLDFMEREGDRLWVEAAERCRTLAGQLKHAMTSRGLPDLIEHYSSWFVINTTEADPRATLLYPLMRMEGVHVMDGFCGFLTTEHGEAECARVLSAFEKALDTLLSVGILADLRAADAPALPAAAKLAPATQVPLTESQREIWMSHQMGGAAAAAFNECGSLTLDGTLDAGALQSAWDAMIARHDALRLRFARDGSTFDVTDPAPLPLAHLDLTGAADPQQALDALIAEEGETPFDITAEPPLRGTLVTLSETSHVLVMTMHHIVADGWSFGVMLDDLAALYAARVEGRSADLPPAPSFAAHARAASAKLANGATMAFWKAQYETIPALPDMPVDRPRPERKSYSGGTVFHTIAPEAVKAARKMGGKHGCTLFATTFTAMQVLVSRLSGARDVVLGVPTAEQQTLPNPNLVGHCVNFLPVRAPMAEGASVAAHMQAVRDRMMAAFDHQDTTFGAIVQALEIPRKLDRLPLTEIEFNLEKDSAMAEMPGLKVGFHPNAKRAVNFDLFFNLAETSEGLRIDAHYNADLYDEETVRGWTRAYETVLAAMVADPEQPVAAVSTLAEADRLAIGAEMNATARAYDRQATLTDLIDRSVAAHAGDPAVEDAEGTLTYAALAARSDALAALIQSRVPGRGQRVALCLPRGAGMLAGLLAVLKAGHTYVPLDPRQPAARLASICETAEVAAILTDSAETAGFAEGGPLPLILTGDAEEGATPEPVQVSPEQAAYVIFTSGSTGTPKGVAVPHRAVVNFLASMAEEPGLSASDTLLAVTTVMFDIAVLELLLPLTKGAKLVIAKTEDVIDGFKLVERLNRGDVTVMQATPTLWDMVLTAGFQPRDGFRMLCGGEPLPADLAQRLTAQGAELWNMYGPTETTIWSAVKRVEPGQPITIGHPIANTELHILDDAGQIAPVGATGELNIGGDGLALGYFNRDDLTATAFRTIGLGDTPRKLYATGDLARRRADGEIEVLGRIDTQVKLRGFRIELGEIETRLRALPGVDKAAVDLRARGTGDRQLVGYVVPVAGQDPAPEALTEALARDLPDYMIPRAWVTLSSLPQTGNGKLDRKALPDPAESASVTPLHSQVAAETETEKRIAGIWAKVLGHEQIGVTDTLFTLGVDSLAVFRIAAQMLDAGLNLEARDMFAHPSIRQLAAFHDSRGGEPARPARPSLKDFRNGARRNERRPAE
jgi:amino acid adenylation domain-containing protein